jgi:hypothetical protein
MMTATRFAEQTAHIEYAEKGMFFSELFLFLQVCEQKGVTLILESGVSRGVSTRVLNALMPTKVISVSWREPIEPLPDADIRIGDGMKIIPQLIAEYHDETIGVLLDGPKGEEALALKLVCFRFPNVEVVACHDQQPGKGEAYHSKERTFRTAVGKKLDARIPEPYASSYPSGPGLGVWTR